MLLVLEPLEGRLLFSTVLTVTTAANGGTGSLRAAIKSVNSATGNYVIDFAIPDAGVHTINLLSPLPTINHPVKIDGTSQQGYSGLPLIRMCGVSAGAASGLVLAGGDSEVLGLDINRFSIQGIILENAGGDTIAEDFLGTDPTGTLSRPNSANGILIENSNDNTIGSATVGDGNVISGNTLNGIRIFDGSTGNTIEGNKIGVDVSGTNPLANGGNGVALAASGNVTGTAAGPNVIAFNDGNGVYVTNGANADPIQFNSIFSNGVIGISLNGGNSGIAVPSLTYASSANGTTAVGGTVTGADSTTYQLQFFAASGTGQGKQMIGSASVTTTSTGSAMFELALAANSLAGSNITATATDPSGNTSEFATNISVISAVFPTADEEYLVALTNRARANPTAEATMDGIDLNEGPPTTPITTTPKQPLAINPLLVNSADGHDAWMLSSQVFSHYGPNNEDPGQRMTAAGYVFAGNWTWGENIADEGTTGTLDPDAYTLKADTDLFVDASEAGRGHRINIEDPSFVEIGTGIEIGEFQSYDSLLATEDFATTAGNNFLTGIAYNDTNDNDFYDPGEGLGGVTVTATNVSTGAKFSVVTWASGGYSLQLAPGTYNVVASGSELDGSVTDNGVVIGTQNIEVDFHPVGSPAVVASSAVAAVSFSETPIGTNISGGIQTINSVLES
jgi:hypothetical protein